MRAWKRHRLSLVSGLSVATVLLLWSALTLGGVLGTRVLPSPLDLAVHVKVLWEHGYVGTPFGAHFAASLFRALVGFVCAVVLGVPLGLMMGFYPTLSAAVSPLFAFIRPIPSIAFIPLVILWFGIGEFSKIVLIFNAAFLYIVLNCAAGVRSVPRDLIRAGLTMGFTRRQLFVDVILPASLPHVITGIKMATVVSWTVVVAAELVAAQRGLGYVIMDAATFFRIPDLYIGIAAIGAVGFVLETIESYIERSLLHWSGK